MPADTIESFTARYGFPPQEYFNRVVKSDAESPRLAEYEADLAKAQKTLAACKGWEALQATDPKFQAGANAENEIAAYTQLIQSAKWHQDAAKKFLAGEIPNYLPYLGHEGWQLYQEGLIDTTAVPA